MASTFAQLFVLEYANGMTPAWGRLGGTDAGVRAQIQQFSQFYALEYAINQMNWYTARGSVGPRRHIRATLA